MTYPIPTIDRLGVLADRIRTFDAEDADRFDAAIECLGGDAASRIELQEDMLAYLREERRMAS